MEQKKKIGIGWIIIDVILVIISIVSLFLLQKMSADYKDALTWNDAKLVLYEGPKSLQDATEEDLKSAPENARDFTTNKNNAIAEIFLIKLK